MADFIVQLYMDSDIKFKSNSEAWFEEQANAFCSRCNSDLQGVYGAIDCTYIYIITPDSDQWFDYIDKDRDICIKAQGLCDYNYEILDVLVGYPGGVHDSSIFQASKLYDFLENTNNFITQRFKILGDSAYPSRNYLIKASNEVSSESARSVIENCFGQIKQQWRILLKRLDCSTDRIPLVVIACCVFCLSLQVPP